MSIPRKKQMIIDVARKLFAQKGLNGITMYDLADAAQVSRRTLYVYFSNKEDIYFAVIQSELDRLSERLDEVASRDMDPELKIASIIYTHLNAIKDAVVRNGSLRAEFFRNIWMVEKVRKAFDQEERDLYCSVISDGCQKGRFHVESIDLVADIIHYCVKGLEVPYIYGRLGNGMTLDESRPVVINMIKRMLGINTPHHWNLSESLAIEEIINTTKE